MALREIWIQYTELLNQMSHRKYATMAEGSKSGWVAILDDDFFSYQRYALAEVPW